jgi:hypothetical protein
VALFHPVIMMGFISFSMSSFRGHAHIMVIVVSLKKNAHFVLVLKFLSIVDPQGPMLSAFTDAKK